VSSLSRTCSLVRAKSSRYFNPRWRPDFNVGNVLGSLLASQCIVTLLALKPHPLGL
jgi:hypothetical protein